MSERTGGHYLDTGEGPVQLDAVAPLPPRELAWQTYQAHQKSCRHCRTRVVRCTEGEELWQDFIGKIA
jgi:superfamily II DNA/RNA helicase